MLTTCSNLVVNYLMAAYGDAAIAGIGVAKRVNMASFAITQGITQGALPLIGYNYASGDRRRMRSSILFMSACTFGFALICLTISLSCTEPLIRAFIDSDETVAYGTRFLRIICWAVLSASVGFIAVTVFQATGKKFRALLLSVLRKGGLDVPLMFILDAHFPAIGIAMATPIADYTAALVAIIFLVLFLRTAKRTPLEAAEPTSPEPPTDRDDIQKD